MSKYESLLKTSDLINAILSIEDQNPPKKSLNYSHLLNYQNLSAYRRPHPNNNSLYEYIVYGQMNLPAKSMYATYTDLEFRNSWDPYSKCLRVVEKDVYGPGTDLVYWRVCYPFPFTHRDYLYRAVLDRNF